MRFWSQVFDAKQLITNNQTVVANKFTNLVVSSVVEDLLESPAIDEIIPPTETWKRNLGIAN